jgi:hypothetical protein
VRTYGRAHLESEKTIIEKLAEEFDCWSLKVMTKEDGRQSLLFLRASTLEDEWTRVQSVSRT